MSKGKQRNGRRAAASDGGNRIRVRGKRLDEVDGTKLTLAYWLLAKRLVEDRTSPRLPTESEVLEEAKNSSEDSADVEEQAA